MGVQAKARTTWRAIGPRSGCATSFMPQFKASRSKTRALRGEVVRALAGLGARLGQFVQSELKKEAMA